MNGALFLKTNFFSPNAKLLFASLVAVTIAAVLLGASKSLAVNTIFFCSSTINNNAMRITMTMTIKNI